MRKRIIALAVLVAMVSGACVQADGVDPVPTTVGPTSTPPDGPSTTLPNGIVGPVFIDSTEILYLESHPAQVRLEVRGSLPTPCHELRWSIEDLGWSIEVTLWSVILLGQDCAQVLEPFETSIPLGSYESASVPVVLNGESIGRISIGTEPATGALIGAGWSFGMCGGYCKADLVVADGSVQVTGGGWTSREPLFVNRGTLTDEGLRRIADGLMLMQGAELDDVYGCPDCADGGSAYVVLDRSGVVSRHDMEFGRPPEMLADLHATALGIIDALEDCESDELVIVDDQCQPWEDS
jgi:hypothetical protein